MILIVTHRADITADYLILELQRRRTPYYRFNTDAFPTEMSLTVHNDGSFQVASEGKTLHSPDIRAAWYRRYEAPPLNGIDSEYHTFIKGEARAFLDSLWKSLNVFWVSHPSAIQRAEGKMNQLQYARRKGMRTPFTLVTNDAKEARSFSSSRPTVAKPFREKVIEPTPSEARRIIFTTQVSADETEFQGLKLAPVIFQEEVPKDYEVRITAIGDKLFGTALDSQAQSESRVDWRREQAGNLLHTPINLPDEVASFCRDMLADYDLRFGAFDFAVTPEGEWVFFELNPNGQWAWIEPLTKQPLRETLADLLESPHDV